MRLREIRVHLLDLTLRVPFTTSFGTYRTLPRPFVVIETADGRRGVGEVPTLLDPAYKAECDTPAVLTSLREFLLPSVAKAHAARGEIRGIDDLRDASDWVKGAVFAKSGIEAAFWDLTAQAEGKPLWRLWGGDRRSFPVGVSIGGKSLDDVLRLADNAVGLGYRRLKVKIWPGFDEEPTRVLRERFPDVLLQVDANSAYTIENWARLKALDPYDLLLIEQPLYDDDIVLHSEIAKELRTPVCLDESIHSLRDTRAAMRLWERNDALDRLVVNIKPPRVSGYREAIAIAKACDERRVRTWIGGMLDSSWGKAMNLSLNSLNAVHLPGDHFSPSGAYFERDVTLEPLVAKDGAFTLGNGVSTGLTFDWDFLEQSAPVVAKVDLRA